MCRVYTVLFRSSILAKQCSHLLKDCTLLNLDLGIKLITDYDVNIVQYDKVNFSVCA